MTPLILALALGSAPRTFDLTVYSQRLFDGKATASGERYRHNGPELTCATRDYPMGSRLRITHKGRTIECMVNDKIHVRYKGRRIDLNGTAWKRLSRGARPGVLRRATVVKLPG